MNAHLALLRRGRTLPRNAARAGRRPLRVNRGMATVELLMALAPLFVVAWALAQLGRWGCEALLSLASYLMTWALL